MREAIPFIFLAVLALLSATIVRVMVRVGALDHPGARSSHSQPTPKGGGVGIVAAFCVGLGAVMLTGWREVPQRHALGLLAGSLVIAVVSYVDDVRNWPFAVKLAAQVACATLVAACGIRFGDVELPGVGLVHLHALGIVLAVCWIVFITNAVNFIDGLNGLASGTVAIAGLFLAVMAAQAQNGLVEACGLALAGGIAGFLPFNFPRARIFMGDVGSQTCGFIIACLGIVAARQAIGSHFSVLLLPALLWGVLFDVAFTLVRRLVAGDRLTEAHRSHLYQIAHRAGVPDFWVAVTYWFLALWGGVCIVVITRRNDLSTVGATLIVTPEILWLVLVVWLAKRRRVGRW